MTDTINTENASPEPEENPSEKVQNEKKERPSKPLPKKGTPLSFWISIILGILFLLSLGTNIMLFFLLGARGLEMPDTASIGEEKFLQGDKSSKNKVLVISVEGAIIEVASDSIFYEQKSIVKGTIDQLKEAAKDQNIKGIIFSVNSPGGGITECDSIYREILKFKEKRPEVPIVVSMTSIAASGGYYISAPADMIYAQPTTITGSIGVIMQLTNITELFEKLGLKNMTFKSGKLKDIGSSTREMTPEEEELINNMVKEMSSIFLQVVKDNRTNLTEEQIKVISDARIFTANQAKEIGLIDEIGYLEDAFFKVKELAKLDSAKLIKKKNTPSFLSFLEETSEKITPGVRVEEEFEKVFTITPRLMYLWTGY